MHIFKFSDKHMKIRIILDANLKLSISSLICGYSPKNVVEVFLGLILCEHIRDFLSYDVMIFKLNFDSLALIL